MINAPCLACSAGCGAFLCVLGLLPVVSVHALREVGGMFWGLFPVEEVECDWGCHGEVVSDAVVDFVDWCGFDFFDAVE